jgi:hypothetical protein
VDSAVLALDSARRHTLGLILRVRPLRAVFVAPRLRVPAAALFGLAMSMVVSLRAPLIALWLGAAIFGVPHVVAGVRHVAIKRSVTRTTRALVVIAGAVGIAQLAAPVGTIDWAPRAFVVLFGAAVTVEILAARAVTLRAALMLTSTVLAVVVGLRQPVLALLVLAHVHALSSLVYAAIVARRRGVSLTPVIFVASLVTIAGAVGVLDALMPAALVAPRSAAMSIAAEATGASLDGLGAIGFRRALFLYAFGQSLHFAMWLRVMPEVDRPSPTPWSWRRALVALRADFGRLTMPLIGLCVLSVPVILIGGGVARESYFALTYFHFGLEAAALARLALRPARASV